MQWRFTLIDKNNIATVIDEPVGWDGFSIKLKRHPERHGTFREIQGNSFEFHGKAATLLKSEYEANDIRSVYSLLIEWRCGQVWKTFYNGIISFDTYEFIDGETCSVKIDVEQSGALVDFINRFDQAVDLDSSIGFDLTTILPTHPRLTRNVTFVSKAIVLRGIVRNTSLKNYSISGDSGWFFPLGTGTVSGSINVSFDTTDVNSIKVFSPINAIDFFRHTPSPVEYTPELIYNDPEQELNYTGSLFKIEFRVKGRYKNNVGGSGTNNLNLVLRSGPNTFNDGATTTTHNVSLIRSSSNAAFSQEFDINYTGSINLPPGHKLWLNSFIQYVKTTNYAESVEIEYDPETFFKASVESKCDPTPAKLYMINEVASRITEAITNNEINVHSEYLGRKDSSPYSFPSAGCAAVRALTTGLHIRRAKMADGTEPKLFFSMQDLFNHLSATDNIGIGYEANRIRIEPWYFFYKNNIIHTCKNIDEVSKKIKESENISLLRIGYDKWETEDFNGQDEILTKREFRTQITQTQNSLDKLSKVIASGYAIETTRRKGTEDKDWRFDNDVFVICLRNKIFATGAEFINFSSTIFVPFNHFYQVGFQSRTITITGSASNDGTYTVTGVSTFLNSLVIQVSATLVNETGANIVIEDISGHYAVEVESIDSPSNLVDPQTVYNYRISPIRMAMKWFKTIAAFCKKITNNDKLIFSKGEGNFVASGQLKNECVLEAAAIAENANISIPSFSDVDDAMPIDYTERVEFKYPLSQQEFLAINSSPDGLIEYAGKKENGFGWIDELEYFPNEGSAKFLLIPKRAN